MKSTSNNNNNKKSVPNLITESGMDEAEQDFVGLSGLFGFGLVYNSNHFINAFWQEGKALHLVDVMTVLVSFTSPMWPEQNLC